MANPAAATQLSKHPINDTLKRLTDASETKERVETREVLDEIRKAVLDRVFMFTRRLGDLVGNASDADVSFNALNAINNALSNVASEVTAFFADKNPGHIDNAASHLDSATDTASWAFFQVPAKGSRAYGESVAAVEKAASEAITSLNEQRASVSAEINKTSEQITSQQQTLTELRQQVTANQQASEAAVGEIRTSFQTIEADFRKKVDLAETEKATSFDGFVKKLEKKSSDVLKALSEHEIAAKRIVQIVGNVGVTGNYQNRAQEERTQADLWRWVTVALFATGVILVTVSLAMHLADRVNLTTLVTRFAIGVAITIPAFYTARESARHRTNADRAKQTELELASLGPFLETLPSEQRQQIIASLAKEYFGRVVDAHQVQAPISADEVQKTIAATADLIGKVKTP
jgi:hypothetical protein